MTTEISSSEKKIQTASELTAHKFQCYSPDRELIVYKKWLGFVSDSHFKKPQFVRFSVENREPYPVSYHVKAREKLFRMDQPSGFLKSNERRELKLYLISSDDWPLAVSEYSQKRLKVAVESIRVPEELEPLNQKEASLMAKNLWKRSFNDWPLERLYTKINVHLVDGSSSATKAPPPPSAETKN